MNLDMQSINVSTEAIWMIDKAGFINCNYIRKIQITGTSYPGPEPYHRSNLRPAVNRQAVFPPEGLAEQRNSRGDMNATHITLTKNYEEESRMCKV